MIHFSVNFTGTPTYDEKRVAKELIRRENKKRANSGETPLPSGNAEELKMAYRLILANFVQSRHDNDVRKVAKEMARKDYANAIAGATEAQREQIDTILGL